MSSQDIKRLKAANLLEDVARDYGITFDSKGRGRCPFHERHNNADANPSLHLDGNHQRLRCQSQNCFDGPVDAIGLVMKMDGIGFSAACQKLAQRAGLSNGHTLPPAQVRPQIVATHDYPDEAGNLLFQTVRKEPGRNGHSKDFLVRRPDGKGGWINGLGDVQPVLYRLPDLLKSGGPAVIVEGEKCADALWALGIPATCNPFGAGTGKWREEFSAFLKGREVVLWPDKDEVGRRHMEQVGQSVTDVAAAIRWLEPPAELPDKGDVADGVQKLGWTPEKVLELLQAARPWEPAKADLASDGPYILPEVRKQGIALVPRPVVEFMAQAQEVRWRVQDLLPEGAAMVIVADSSTGKTWLTLVLALAVDQGMDFLGRFPAAQGKVLIIDEENADSLLKHRLKKLLRGLGLPEDGSTLGIEILTAEGVNLSDRAYVDAVERLLAEKRPALVIIDALVRIHRGNENDAGEMARIFGHVKRWMVEFGCCFVFCHHRKKPALGLTDPSHLFRGSSEIRAFMDSQLDLRPVKGERGLVTVEHAKSRYIEPVPTFNLEIVDPAEGQTVVRYAGEPKTMTQGKMEEAQEFIRSLVADGEWHNRKSILDQGIKAGFKRDTLDTARKLMVEAGEIGEEKHGKQGGVRQPGVPSDGPTLYIEPSETADDAEALFDLEEVRV